MIADEKERVDGGGDEGVTAAVVADGDEHVGSVGHREYVDMAFGMGQFEAFSSEIVNVGKLMSFFSNSLISSGES